jgi:hypothetical protein
MIQRRPARPALATTGERAERARRAHRSEPPRSSGAKHFAVGAAALVAVGTGVAVALSAAAAPAAPVAAGLGRTVSVATAVPRQSVVGTGRIGVPWSTRVPSAHAATATPAATAGPAAAPAAAGVSSGKLTWAPPALTSPQTVKVVPGRFSLKLDPLKDYRVVLPSTPVTLGGAVTITGGRNVVIMGGIISVPSRSTLPADNSRRGLYLKGQTGTIHIEGVHLTGDLSDGVNLDERLGAVVQLENIKIDMVHGSHDGHHADVVQTWAGPRILRIDGLLAGTQYQGMFLLPNQQWKSGPAPQEFTIRRSVIAMEPGSAYALWLPHNSPWMDWSGLTIALPQGKSQSKLSWPNSHLGLATVSNTGQVLLNQGEPGPAYRSPGYVSAG